MQPVKTAMVLAVSFSKILVWEITTTSRLHRCTYLFKKSIKCLSTIMQNITVMMSTPETQVMEQAL